MSNLDEAVVRPHSHVFLGAGHAKNERRTWGVIALCSAMMAAEIVGGILLGSIALVADGLHMSTHAGALLLAALAYSYARRHAEDARFSFGTGKLGDLAGFTSAIVLAMIALLIGYEAIARLIAPVSIRFDEAIAIAAVGLLVNVASVWMLGGADHHRHGHGHGHGGAHDQDDPVRRIATPEGALLLEIFEQGVPPRFRLRAAGDGTRILRDAMTIETVRSDGSRQAFPLVRRAAYLESVDVVPEPHAFIAHVRADRDDEPALAVVSFEEHEHDGATRTHRDNNLRSALIHVMADAVVSILVIAGLLLGRFLGWVWMDPVAGIFGAIVIASWSYGLVRDTGRVLLDMTPDDRMAENIRSEIERDGDRLSDLHLWRLGPGHIGAIVSVATSRPRRPGFYRQRLARFPALSHITIEVEQRILRPAA